jgi:uncharacterized membrane protein YbhN (UPF0104 family)
MGTDPLGALTVFITQMIGLSVAAERVTETVKQWVGPMLARLSTARYAALIQTIAMVSGVLVVACSGLNPLNIPQFKAFGWTTPLDWLSWLLGGVLVSGGSAFWNHILDILQAVKVRKEQVANLATTVSATTAVNAALMVEQQQAATIPPPGPGATR